MQQNPKNILSEQLETSLVVPKLNLNYPPQNDIVTKVTHSTPFQRNDIFEKSKLQDFLSANRLTSQLCNFINKNTYTSSNNILCINNNFKLNFISNSGLHSHFDLIINLISINTIKHKNNFLELTNAKLSDYGMFIGVFETYESYRYKNNAKYPQFLNFLIKKIIPLRRFTRIKNRFVSKAEALGRLCCCGFEITDEKIIDDKLYFAASKKQEPFHPNNKSSGFFIKLPRVGKNKKIIQFYKIRTMYPYSEYLQEYIYNEMGLQLGGKINSDFRISRLGKFLRKYWIDEIPMLINLLKGEIKLVGVRPLSLHYFSLYSSELQELRVKTKPGLIPPFYVDSPKTLNEIMDSEIKYLKQHQKKPLYTDIKYFFKAMYNIVIRGYRSY